MKVLSLTQPWASLVANGSKGFETRSWSTAYRGPLAIHAAKGFPGDCRVLCDQEPFRTALGGASWRDLPRGEILCVVTMLDCISTMTLVGGKLLTPLEKAFGDYAPGRFGWMLGDVKLLPRRVPAKGALGLWEFDLGGAVPPSEAVGQGSLFA